MKTKHRKTIPKTRGHKQEKKPYVPIRKHAIPCVHGERKETNTEEYCKNTEWKGSEGCGNNEGRENKDEQTQVIEIGNTENSEKSVHPGPVQTLPEVYKRCADDTETTETEIEAEELQ